MKSILGFKAKANTMMKERVEQSKPKAQAQSTVQKPFEDSPPRGKEPNEADHGSQSGSRSPSPAKQQTQVQHQHPGISQMDPVLEHLLQNARSDAVREEFLQQPAEEYTTKHSLRLLAGTYNVNGRTPAADLDLKPWLDTGGADIIAVAFQEIVPLNAQNVVIGARLDSAAAWDSLIDVAINGSSDREEGHLVIRSQTSRAESEGKRSFELSSHEPFKHQALSPSELEAALDAMLTFAAAHHNFCLLRQLSQGDSLRPNVLRSSELTDGILSDPEEGYLSPAEDTYSIFSDEQSKQKPYTQLVGKQMVGIYLSVWVRRALLKQIRGVQVTSVGTGIMGYLGNKGAVAARLRIFDSGLTIIAAHLSSGEQEGDELKRNYDYSEIVRRGQFPPDSPGLEPDSIQAGAPTDVKIAGLGKAPGQWGSFRGLLDTAHVVWMGDLNYRLNMQDAQARSALKAGNIGELAANDELKTMMKEQRAFQGWQEGDLSFPPTFKFKLGSNIYIGDEDDEEAHPESSTLSVSSTAPSVTSSSPNTQGAMKPEGEQKRRTPAWTDRILWRPHSDIKQLGYSAASLTASDHRPVIASFSFKAKEYLRNRVEAAIDQARRVVDAREMASMPRCDLEPLAVDAGNIRYTTDKTLHLILTNTGQVKARWQFAYLPGSMFNEPQDQALRRCPRWAQLSPEEGVLAPGEATEVRLKIWVDGGQEGSAMLLTTKAGGKLDAILVLRVEDGNDIFCSINGSYLPSFFGLPLTLLAALPRPLVSTDGDASALPKLKVNTLKKTKTQNNQSNEANLMDFYSPLSSFHNSPLSDADAAAARDKAHKKVGSRSSIGSELEAFSLGGEDITTNDEGRKQSEDGKSKAVHAAPGIEAQQMTERVESGASAGPSADPLEAALRHSRTGSTTYLVPPELSTLTAFLKDRNRLQTPGLFVNSVELAHAVSPRSPASQQIHEEASAVMAIRAALDTGQKIDENASPQDVAATILAFFCAMPSPFMPLQASHICQPTVPSKAAASQVLGEAMSPAEWAIFRHMTDLMASILAPHNAAKNGVTREGLANLFAEVWFERMPLGYKAASQELRAENVADLQKLADGVSQVAERRTAFIASFL